MAGNITWNMAGFRALRTDPAVMAELDRLAKQIADAAGPGFEANPPTVTGGRVRGRASVVSATRQAAAAEASNHVLLRAVGGSRA